MSTKINQGLALITGASSGIGAVYADRLAHRGYDLILVARDAAALSKVVTTIGARTGRKVETITADFTNKTELLRVEERLRSDSSITALVNNAGFGATAKLVDSPIDEMDRMIQVNVTALTRLTAAALPGFLNRANGLIINISSIAALAPELLNGVYSGTKAYVINLTQSLHHEVGGKGIQVQAVVPGAIGTGFWERAGLPLQNLPETIVMTPEELVDAALAGLDQHELVTIPSLPDVADWEKVEAARIALGPNLSTRRPADRYRVPARTAGTPSA